MAKFRKKPVVIEAIRYRGDNGSEVEKWAKNLSQHWPSGWIFDEPGDTFTGIVIPTLEGELLARPGDYIICGIKGEFYPRKPDIFAQTYDLEDSQP